jgi:hypothetical protein
VGIASLSLFLPLDETEFERILRNIRRADLVPEVIVVIFHTVLPEYLQKEDEIDLAGNAPVSASRYVEQKIRLNARTLRRLKYKYKGILIPLHDFRYKYAFEKSSPATGWLVINCSSWYFSLYSNKKYKC